MVSYCAVPCCTGTSGFRFPKDKQLKRKWQVAIRRVNKNKNLWKPSKQSVVCEKHFRQSDFSQFNLAGFPRVNRTLVEGAVPSIFQFQAEEEKKETDEARIKRQNERAVQKRLQEEEKNKEKEEEEEEEVSVQDLDFAMEIEISEEEVEQIEDEPKPITTVTVGVQASVFPSIGSMKIEQFELNPKAMNYYTGFQDINHFRFFLHCLGPAAFCLKYSSRALTVEDELFLCLMKLRLNKGKLQNIYQNKNLIFLTISVFIMQMVFPI